MALNCGWEILITHNSGTVKRTCGFNGKPCVVEGCKKKAKCRKAYDMPVPPEATYMMQAGERIWPKIK